MASTLDSQFEISATLPQNRSGILPILHGALCECGAWILTRESVPPGLARLSFEFPRDICREIYSALMSLGLDLAPCSHRALTELCRCTPYLFELPSRAVTAVDGASLEKATRYICSLEIVRAELYIEFRS